MTAALIGTGLAPATADVAIPAPPGKPVLVHEGDSWTIRSGSTVVPLPEAITDNSTAPLPGLGDFDLLGVIPRGYVVSEFTRELDQDGYAASGGRTQFELHLVAADGSATTFHEAAGEADGAWARLSANGRRVFVSTPVDDFPDARVVDLDGTVTAMPARFGSERVLDFLGPKLLHAQHVRTKRFTGEQLVLRNLKRNTSRIRLRVANDGFTVADLQRGVVAWRKPRVGKTPVRTSLANLAQPKKVLWTKKFDALALNPTAKRVLGWGPKGRLQVRRVSNGKVVAKLPAGLPTMDVVWESKKAVLIAGPGSVTRCDMSGACAEIVTVAGGVDLP